MKKETGKKIAGAAVSVGVAVAYRLLTGQSVGRPIGRALKSYKPDMKALQATRCYQVFGKR